MKKRLGVVLVLAGLAAVQTGSSVARAQSGDVSREVANILAAALGPSRLEGNLQRLTDEIGGRRSTSPEMQRAASWAVVAFQQAGVDKVAKEPFYMMSSWAPGETTLEVLAPQTSPVRIIPLGWSPNTLTKGLEAPVLDVGEGTEEDFARLGSRAEGAFLLVHTPVLHTWEDLFAEYGIVAQAQPRAYAAGAAGILWMSSRMKKQLYRRAVGWGGEIGPIPEALVAREDALRLSRLLAKGKHVQARVSRKDRARQFRAVLQADTNLTRAELARPGWGVARVGNEGAGARWSVGSRCPKELFHF